MKATILGTNIGYNKTGAIEKLMEKLRNKV